MLNKEKILSFPFLNKQTDIRFITWSLISPVIWSLDSAVRDILLKNILLMSKF